MYETQVVQPVTAGKRKCSAEHVAVCDGPEGGGVVHAQVDVSQPAERCSGAALESSLAEVMAAEYMVLA